MTLSLTPAGISAGYTLTLFASGFPAPTPFYKTGVTGITPTVDGGVLISAANPAQQFTAEQNGLVWKLPNATDGQTLPTPLTNVQYWASLRRKGSQVYSCAWVAPGANDNISLLDNSGNLTTGYTNIINGLSQQIGPLDFCFDAAGNLYTVSNDGLWYVPPSLTPTQWVTSDNLFSRGCVLSADESILYTAGLDSGYNDGVFAYNTSNGSPNFVALTNTGFKPGGLGRIGGTLVIGIDNGDLWQMGAASPHTAGIIATSTESDVLYGTFTNAVDGSLYITRSLSNDSTSDIYRLTLMPSSSSSSSSQYNDVGGTYCDVLPNPIYDLCQFNDSTGANWMLCTSGGKVYKTLQGSGTYTELLDTNRQSYDLNSPIAQAVRVGGYAYIVDSGHPLIRISLDGEFPAYAMQPPTQPPTVALSDITVDSPTSVDWIPGPTPINFNSLITNGYWDTPGGAVADIYLPGAPWAVQNGPYVLPANSPDYGDHSVSAGHSEVFITGHPYSLLLNEVTNSVGQAFYPPYNTATAWPNPSTLLKNACFLFACQLQLRSPGSNASLAVTVQAFNGAGGMITQQTQILNATNTAGWSQVSAAFNFTTSFTTDPASYLLILSSGPNNTQSNGIWVAGCTLIPLQDGPLISDVGGSQVKWTANYGCIGGSHIVRTYGTPKDFSGVGSLGFDISSTNVPLADLYIRFGFVAFPSSSSSSSSSSATSGSSSSSGYPFDGAGIVYWSNNIKFNDAGTFGSVDITTIPSDVLASVHYLFIDVVLDLPTGDVSPGTPTNILTFGPLTAAGELSEGYQYIYYVTESARIDASNVVESNPSPPSAAVTTSAKQAEFDITIPSDCYVNSATNKVSLWRLGGVWSDARLIATVSTSVSVPYGTDPANPWYSWDKGTRTFLDNTPDSFLSLADLLSFGRYPMPANAQAVSTWQGRLEVAVGNVIYISWLFNADNSAPLYTTLVQTTGDPNLPVEGAFSPVSEDPSDTIVRMVPYGTPITAGNQFGGGLVIYCKRSVWLLQGQNAADFSLQQYPYTPGVGLVAMRGVTRIDSNTMAFLGPDRIHLFPPTADTASQDRGLPIQPQLYPVPPQTLMDGTAFSKAWMLYHDQKIYLGCPVPGGTRNSVIWVYDLRIQGWTRWTGPKSGLAFPLTGMACTGAMSLPPTTLGAAYDLYLYGLDGQIYRVTGLTDRYTSLSVAAPIPFTITCHALRPSFFVRYKARPLYYMWARLERYEVEMIMTGTLTMTAQAWQTGTENPVAIPGKVSTQSYTLASGGRTFRGNLPPGLIEGAYLTFTLSGEVSDVAYLRGVRGFVSGSTYEQGP